MFPATTDDAILSRLSPADLIHYAQTSRQGLNAVSAYKRRAFSVERLLKRFFSETETMYFRYLQSRTGMFISGSSALQFFDRSFYPNSDLDIYVEHRHKNGIATFLNNIGYIYTPKNRREAQTLREALGTIWHLEHEDAQPFFESKSEGYFGRGVANVYTFFKYNPERKIQLIAAHHSPLEILLNFHSTCVMNLITHNKAYSLYPVATFEERRSLMYSTEGSNQEAAREKYVERGWKMVERLNPNEVMDSKSSFASGNRYVGDSRCWMITLPPVPNLTPRDDFVETNTWSLLYDETLKPIMSFRIMLTDKLTFSYLIADERLEAYIFPAIIPNGMVEQNLDRDILQLLRLRR